MAFLFFLTIIMYFSTLTYNKLTMEEWFLNPLKEKFADFSGRARRKEFWMFYLFCSIISSILSVIDSVLDLGSTIGFGVLSPIFSLIILIPYLAVSVRRLHDTNKTGWYLLLLLLPIIGWIWLLVLFVIEGDEGKNEYGDDPKNPVNELDHIGVSQH